MIFFPIELGPSILALVRRQVLYLLGDERRAAELRPAVEAERHNEGELVDAALAPAHDAILLAVNVFAPVWSLTN